MSNRANGNRFEMELSRILRENGFWCHVMQQNKAGQPADIIAVKNRFHTLIDCKVISDNRGFPFSRIEENQKFAMERFEKMGGTVCWFALKLPNGEIRMLSYPVIKRLRNADKKVLNGDELLERTNALETWLNWAKVVSIT